MRLPRPLFPRFAPFLDEMKGYGFSFLRHDLFAGFSVALMTIPQSIAYALLAGLPPMAGVFSAIFGTIFSAIFSSSRQIIAGPSTGTAILLQTSIAGVLYTYFPNLTGEAREAFVLHLLLQFVILMGLIQLGSSFFNVAKVLQFVSRPVILGYFAGITTAIGTTQAFSLTGVQSPGGDRTILYQGWYFLSHLSQVQFWTSFVGITSFICLILLRKIAKNWPNALLMLIGSSLLVRGLLFFGIETVETLASFQLPAEPFPRIQLPLLDLNLLPKIFPAALALSFLAILEMFSVSRAFAAKNGYTVSANQDVFALGVSNTILAFLSGSMPTSGSPSRTALNVRLQAKTRLAAILSGVITALGILFCWPLMRQVPLAALSALLIAGMYALTDWKEIKFSIRATQADAWVFFLTFFSCLIFSLDVAFFIGIVISIGNYLKQSSTPHLVEYAFNAKGRLVLALPKSDTHRKVRIIGIGGDLYFATADVFQAALEEVARDRNVQAIVLRLNNVYHMDASMCLAILHLYELLEATGRHLVISGLTEEVWHVFHRTGLVKKIHLDNLYFTDESNPQFSTWKACLRAQELIHPNL